MGTCPGPVVEDHRHYHVIVTMPKVDFRIDDFYSG